MKHTALFLIALAVLAATAGCKTKAVSRTYDADMQRTWAAVVAVAEKVSEEKPDIDEVNRKIVTGWVYHNVNARGDQGPAVKRTADVWRGIIACKANGDKTKVTISLQKGNLTAKENTDSQDRDGSGVSVVLSSSETSQQDKFLAKVAEELAKDK